MKTIDATLLYVASDGSYGNAADLLLVNAADFTPDDWESLDGVDDRYRQEEAAEIGVFRMAEPVVWAWMTDNEAAEVTLALQTAINVLTDKDNMGLAERLGDVRDVLARSGITY